MEEERAPGRLLAADRSVTGFEGRYASYELGARIYDVSTAMTAKAKVREKSQHIPQEHSQLAFSSSKESNVQNAFVNVIGGREAGVDK